MNKNIKFLLLSIVIVMMGLFGSACSSDQAAIDQAVQQTIEAQQNEDNTDPEIISTNDTTQEINIDPTETPDPSTTSESAEETIPAPTSVESDSTQDTPVADSERIFFFIQDVTSVEGGTIFNNNLFSIKPNGEDLQKITNFEIEYALLMSPDLSHIAYTHIESGLEGASGIYAMPISDIDETGVEPIHGSEGILVNSDFVWSPDSSHIALYGTRLVDAEKMTTENGLFVIDIKADEINFLVEEDWGGYPGLDIAWSTDGEKLAFVSEENDHNTLYILNKDGSDLIELLNEPNSNHIRNLVWSNNNTKITFDQKIDDTNYTKTIDVNSGLVTDQSDNMIKENRGVWSPDGTKLVFADRKDDPNGDYDSNYELYTINADGSDLLQFTEYEPNTVRDGCPIWSPDGTQLAFISSYLTDEGYISELIVSDGDSRTILMRDSEDMSIGCPLAWTP